MLQNAQQGFQAAQGLTGSIKPFLGQFGGKYGQQANDFLSMLGLGKRGGRFNRSQNRNYSTNTSWQKRGFGDNGVSGGVMDIVTNLDNQLEADRKARRAEFKRIHGYEGRFYGGAFKGKSPLSSNPNASNSLDIMNLVRTAQQAQQVYETAKQGSNMIKPFLPEAVSGFLTSIGLGKSRRARKGNDGRSARAEIVRQVMQSQGVSLPMASKIVKEQGLYSGGRMVTDRAMREPQNMTQRDIDKMLMKRRVVGGMLSG